MFPFPVSHFHRWATLSEAELPAEFEHFARAGLRDLTLTSKQSERLLETPEHLDFLIREAGRNGLRYLNAHAPFGENFDLNCAIALRRPAMVGEQKRVFDFCARLGVDAITMHIGTTDSGRPLPELRDLACRSLEILLPEAEKRNLTLLIENTLFPTDTPAELLGYLERFPTPALGVCFDAGHANIMDAAPGKTSDQLINWIRERWNGEVVFETDTLGPLLPHIVSCHLHDNHGFNDEHLPAGDGTIDWPRLLERLAEHAPRLRSVQNENSIEAPGIPPEKIAERFRTLCGTRPEKA